MLSCALNRSICAHAVKADTQEMPNVDNYIAQKAAVYRLQQEMANWERKVSFPFLHTHIVCFVAIASERNMVPAHKYK